MKNIEQNISPLIKSQFPKFYLEEGPDFITFIEAYYEWLENNHQLLNVEDATIFEVGQTVTQGSTNGTVIVIENNDILVLVNGLDTFKCQTICNSYEPLVSETGEVTYVKKGGATKRLGALFLARNLTKLRDIDTTMDLFISHFKEKYLYNIEFDIASNKRLLVKNSLDLYRSKGTARSIDLFFRLMYGVNTTVYYPGEDLFNLSAGEWIKPHYLEISVSSESRAVDLIGKQIYGSTSGATAFVEKYIKRRVNSGFVHVLYLSNISGDFVNRELLISDKTYKDSPFVLGSLTSVEIVTGGKLFSVGDIVSFTGSSGQGGLARVSSIDNKSGVIDFELIEGGFGYTISDESTLTVDELKSRTQSIVSEHVLSLANVQTSNYVSSVVVNNGGTGYSNSDKIIATSLYQNAVIALSTNSTGGIVSIAVDNPGNGFTGSNATYTIANSTGGSSSGTGANLDLITADYDTPFKYFESIYQPLVDITYTGVSNSSAWIEGSLIRIGNSTTNVAFGSIITNEISNTTAGTLKLTINNLATFSAGNTIISLSNTNVNAVVGTVTSNNTLAGIMGLPTKASLLVDNTIDISIGDVIYQTDSYGAETANAVVDTVYTKQLDVSSLEGNFKTSRTLKIKNKASTYTLTSMNLTLGVYLEDGDFTSTASAFIYSGTTGTKANVTSISTGSSAAFKVGSLTNPETIRVNTDLIGGNNASNVAYPSIALNATAYGFPANPTGNSSSILLSLMTFANANIGTINSLTSINPGTDYNIDPYVLAFQPYVSAFDKKDYKATISNTAGGFSVGELVTQTTSRTENDITIDSVTGLIVGERVYQGANAATGIISSINTGTSTITVYDITGTFSAGANVKSYINVSFTSNTSVVSVTSASITAKGIVKEANSTYLELKRIQFENNFASNTTLYGGSSGTTAKLVTIEEDLRTLPIGLNATVDANVVIANGSVTNLEIIDSGLGYSNGEVMIFLSEDKTRTGSIKSIVSGSGTGAGYYRTSKGFLSGLSKIHDGDYYQEYSYDIMSKMPLNKYKDMFKKVMHTAGTRFFGSVLLESLNDSMLDMSANTNESNVITNTIYSNSISNGIITIAGQDLDVGNQIYLSGPEMIFGPNGYYYVSSYSNDALTIQSNPRSLDVSFNANTDIANSTINIPRHNFVNNDVVKYYTMAGNTNIIELANNSHHYVEVIDSNNIKLTSGPGAEKVLTQGLTENGHHLAISSIPILDGGSNNSYSIAYSSNTDISVILGPKDKTPNVLKTLSLVFAPNTTLDSNLTFTRSSSGSYYDANGIMQFANTDEPRHDHSPSSLDYKGILFEEQKTNLVIRSEEFDNAAWDKLNATVSANANTAPDNTLTGDKIIKNNTTSTAYIGNFISAAFGTYSWSAHLKPDGMNYAKLQVENSPFTGTVSLLVDLATKTVISSSTVGTGVSVNSTRVRETNGGWSRYEITFTFTSGTALVPRIYFCDASGSTAVAGNGVDGFYLWGAQLESGYGTSYIRTTTSTTTRAADNMTMPSIATWKTPDKGTFILSADTKIGQSGGTAFELNDGTANNRLGVDLNNSTQAYGYVNGALEWALDAGTITNNTTTTLQTAYSENDIASRIDSGSIIHDTSAIIPNVDRLRIGSSISGSYLNGRVKSLSYYPKRLADSEL